MSSMRRTTRHTRAFLAGAALVAFAVPPTGAQPRVQAELPKLATVGSAETLTVRLVDAEGRPAAAPRDLKVTVVAEGEERLVRSWKLAQGQSQVDFKLTSRAPAVRSLEVVVEGLEPVWIAWVSVPPNAARETAPAPQLREIHQVTAVPPPLEQGLPPAPALRLPGVDAPSPAPPAERPPEAAPPAAETEPDRQAHPERREDRQEPAAARRESALRVGTDVVPTQRERRLMRHVATIAERDAPEADGPAAPGAAPGGEPVADAPAAEAPAAGGEAATPAPAPPAATRLRFSPEHLQVLPGSDGRYQRPLLAAWYVGDLPALADRDLDAELHVVEQPEGLLLDPDRLHIDAAQMSGRVRLESDRHGRARILALLPGLPVSEVVVDLLPPRPAGARFTLEQPTSLQRLGSARLRVSAVLVDSLGRPTVAPENTTLRFSARSEATTSEPCDALVPAGAGGGECHLELSRFGAYVLSAGGPGLAAGEVRFDYRFDLALLLWALLGGVVGAAIEVARRRVRTRAPLVKAYLLGAAAALIVVLLGVFGGLVGIDALFPEGVRDAAAGASQSAVFLLGLLAGFGGEAVFSVLDVRFGLTRRARRRRGGGAGGGERAAEPPADGDAASPPAPAALAAPTE